MTTAASFSQHHLNFDTKGLGAAPAGCTLAQLKDLQWRILDDEVSLPVAVLREHCIEHNLRWMQSFMARYGVKLAPHGKTTMSPALFHRQLEHGAWGITLATASQVNAAYHHGVRRILMANQLVGRGNMALIARIQAQDPDFSFCCIVDSAANIDALGHFFTEVGQRLRVLIEYGVPGGRTGVRDAAQEAECLAALARWPGALALIGVEVYEGVLQQSDAIRGFLQQVLERTRALVAAQRFDEDTVLLSGAGSAWFDVVAEVFSGQDLGCTLDVVLRPGCYLTHDVGIYRQAERRIRADNPVAREMGQSLLPALQLCAHVQSLPEPGRAIIALGKRDAAFDAGLPTVTLQARPGGFAGVRPAPEDWVLTALMDQHAFMSVPEGADLQVGDILIFDISHPCLTFDKWRQLLLVDEHYQVLGAVETLF